MSAQLPEGRKLKRRRSTKRSCNFDEEHANDENLNRSAPEEDTKSLPPSLRPDCDCATSNSISTTTTTRSNLFPAETTTTTAGSTTTGDGSAGSLSRLLAPATQFPGAAASAQPAPASASSLFGAVMNNVVKSTSSSSKNTHFSTPSRTISKFAVSPGGFLLQDFVANYSPFQFTSLQQQQPASSSTPGGGADGGPQQKEPLSTPRRNMEWHECNVGRLVQDWSIKSELEFQFQPATAAAAFLANDAAAQQTAMLEFVRGSSSSSSGIATSRAASCTNAQTEWQAGLLYWQHPANHPLPKELFAAMDNQQQQQHASSKNNRTKKKHAFAAHTAPKDSQHASSSSTSSTADLLSVRGRQWQAAFRSLYLTWIERIHELSARWEKQQQQQARTNSATATAETALLAAEIANAYFYASGPGHTILFRVGLQKARGSSSSEDCSAKRARMLLVPEIVVSSSTLALRELLRSMGVKLFLLEPWNGMRGECNEEAILQSTLPSSLDNSSGSSSTNGKKMADASPTVTAELVALRRAQVYGQTVGADVAVHMRSNKATTNLLSRSPRRIPPVYMIGTDDCAAFFEVYLNTLGQINVGTEIGKKMVHDDARELVHDVPVLLCRKLGPFLHSTVSSLQSSGSKEVSNGDGCATMDLRGYILPCAISDLVRATVGAMRADGGAAQFKSGKDDCDDSDEEEEEDEVGSHHIVVRAMAHNGGDAPAIVEPGIIGSHSSKWMNGKSNLLDHLANDDDKDDGAMPCCRYDEVLKLAVWDITRPESLAYKLDIQSANLLG